MSAWAAFAWVLATAAAQTADTGATGDDVDQDGFSVAAGDCDDTNPDISPVAPEVCADRIDNDCDGLRDENCDRRARNGELRGGGGGCSEGLAAGVILAPLLLTARRRRSRR